MVFQAAIDDSYNDEGTFVFAGYIATEEVWAKFTSEWEKLLPLTRQSKVTKKHRFKMKEMARRMEAVPAFHKVIEDHDLIRISCQFDLVELENAKQRIWIDGCHIDWGFTDNPHFLAFRCLMDMFHTNRALLDKIIPPGEKVDFYFDSRGEKKAIDAMWEDYIRQRPDEVREYYSEAGPKFVDDEEFIPLQAADFWAWWVRKWYREKTPEKIEIEDFDLWKANKKPIGIAISFDEDQLVEAFISLIRPRIEPGRPIFDAKYHPRPVLVEQAESRLKSFWKKLFS